MDPRPTLRLVRLPNTLTAAADVIAGAVLSGLAEHRSVVMAAAGSACLYAGGVALGDICDRERDQRLHPSRPLPRGSISLPWAITLSVSLLALGLVSALQSGHLHLGVTLALVLAIVGYSTLKEHLPALGLLLMAGCRGLNVVRGLTLDGAPPLQLLAAPLALAALVLLITAASRQEEVREATRRLRALSFAMALPYLAPGLLALELGNHSGSLWSLAGGCALWIMVTQPSRTPQAASLVLRAVFSLVLWDALLALSVESWRLALLLAAFLPVMLLLKRGIGQEGS